MEAGSDNFASPESDAQFISEEELQMIEAIEAEYEYTHSHSAKRRYDEDDDNNRPKTRRQLPSSLFAPSPSRSFCISSCRASNTTRMKYPAMRFGGKILYCRTLMEVEKASKELLLALDAKKKEFCQVPLGFDVEWKAIFKRGALPSKTAVMQICYDPNQCYVMHIFHSGIPPSLQTLLEDTAFLKVGAGIAGDVRRVYKDYNVSINAVEDLSYLANKKLTGTSKTWGLASLTETLICKELQKPQKIRLGNWEVKYLSNAQLQYAATDAFASWHLYQVLTSLPDIVLDATKEATES